jgi:hypothetical protein
MCRYRPRGVWDAEDGRPDVNDTLLEVHRVGNAWVVDGAKRLEPLVFLSGAKAEAQAHALARGLAQVGGDARVAIHDRAQQLVGTFRYFAEEKSPPSGGPAGPEQPGG